MGKWEKADTEVRGAAILPGYNGGVPMEEEVTDKYLMVRYLQNFWNNFEGCIWVYWRVTFT